MQNFSLRKSRKENFIDTFRQVNVMDPEEMGCRVVHSGILAQDGVKLMTLVSKVIASRFHETQGCFERMNKY
jgi:hypothetical protein